MMSPGWYARRLSLMGPGEIAGRVTDAARKRRWRRELIAPTAPNLSDAPRRFCAPLPPGSTEVVDPVAVSHLLATADRLMDGHMEYFGVAREDMTDPDWHGDPGTGRRAPADAYAFDVPYRDEATVGDIKQLWEPSRHQHLTVLAGAYALTGDSRYAERVADHLKSWWAANPPLRGVHWVSGIELGIRLLSWVWVRRLLDRWPGAPGLFEHNAEALYQIWHHQRWLAAFPSRGSSANNHVIAETAGQLAAACAFDWFIESPSWRSDALQELDLQLSRNTFDSGLNRELATEYHALVLELGLAGAIEAAVYGMAVPSRTWHVLTRMSDALAAILDTTLRPPRQGDADDGHGLVLDGAGTDRWAGLLATGDAVFGRLDWWPRPAGTDVRTTLLGSIIASGPGAPGRPANRPAQRPAHFADAGMTILRSPGDTSSGEIWCRCDGGPHGFLSIAAHAHADALSVEVRHDGVDVLADPGTFCYHGTPRWRSYFRSTLGHNTLVLDGKDQSTSGGPFMWTRHARSTVLATHTPEHGLVRWSAEHDGFVSRFDRAIHRRTVQLDTGLRELTIEDEVLGTKRHSCRLTFHLGPEILAEIEGNTALLRWSASGTERGARLTLPAELVWTAHRSETDPPLGWYSPSFGRRVPSTSLVGVGVAGGGSRLTTSITFND